MGEGNRAISAAIERIHALLQAKNRAYGDSALSPVRIFSRATTSEGILCRIDDKLSRIQQGALGWDDEDVLEDLIGYLILLYVQRSANESAYTSDPTTEPG
jgi:hypothetical protein